jgi:hypothetical protein
MGNNSQNDAVRPSGWTDKEAQEPCPVCGSKYNWLRYSTPGRKVKVICGAYACDHETEWMKTATEAVALWNVTSKLSG